MEEKITKRIQELESIRTDHIDQAQKVSAAINALNGAIEELKRLLKSDEALNKLD